MTKKKKDENGPVAIIPGMTDFVYDAEANFNYFNMSHLDAATNLFLSRELLFTLPKLLKVIHGQKNARLLFPINRSVPVGAQSYKWEQEEDFGTAAWVTGHGAGIPTVNSNTEELISQVGSFATEAIWTMDEIRAAAFANRPLNARYARAARLAALQFENEVVFNGDTTRNILGVLSGNALTGIPEAAATNGTWTVATQADVDNILEDMFDIESDVQTQSLQNYAATRLVIPLAEFQLISKTKAVLTDGAMETIKEVALRNFTSIREIVPAEEFAANNHPAIDAANPIMMAYEPGPDNMEMVVPMELLQHAPERVKLSTSVIYEQSTGGMSIYRPLTASIRTGI